MLGKWMKESTRTIVFSGAGMSTESGLLDFRSAGQGVWQHWNPLTLTSLEAMTEHKAEFVAFYRWRIEEMKNHSPNAGHQLLVRWEQEGRIHGIITQNVENYHERSGSQRIAKLHGDLGTVRCVDCHASFPSTHYLSSEKATICSQCGGFLRPNTVLFGEPLPKDALELSGRYLEGVQLLIVLGSSLQVTPANQFPKQAKETGAKLVIINKEPTPLDDEADLVIRHRISDVLKWADHTLSFQEKEQ